MTTAYLGIDVGTGSVRAGVFDAHGSLLGLGKRDITLFRGPGSIVEQSANEIWQCVASASRDAVARSGCDSTQIAGIGFDATCSLVVVGKNGSSLPVGPSDDPERNIIVWMDHRAIIQAERINETDHSVLRYVGGRISPEMETPKLLWLKENRPHIFNAAWQFFDLTDYLTWRATGSLARSICTLTCKWTFLGHEKRWDESYFREVGLGELADESFSRIGQEVVEPGTPLGNGLAAKPAEELGVRPGTPVAAGLIDAHAGGIGTVGAEGEPQDNLGYVFGTSSCTMTTTNDPVLVPGIWGPYYSAMVPHTWLIEGGQSAAGAAIDHLITHHPATDEARQKACTAGISLPEWLAERAANVKSNLSEAAFLAGALTVVPEFLGNRAPHANPHSGAVVAGLGMSSDIDSLVSLYVAGICGLGYGLRQIIKAQADWGASIKTIVISGGAGRSDLVRQLLSDATGVPVVAPETDEPVLLGAAMLGAVGAGEHPDIKSAMRAMSAVSRRYYPSSGGLLNWHDQKFILFEKYQSLALEAVSG